MSEVTDEKVKALGQSFAIPDTTYVSVSTFGIDDVRTLIDRAYMSPVVGDKQLLVVSFSTITVESQQALLKLLEEPPLATKFIFCVPSSVFLLPTLLSRFSTLSLPSNLETDISTDELDDFLALGVGDRITTITNRLADKDAVFVSNIKRQLIKKLADKTYHNNAEKLALLYWIAEHLETRGASNKQLLEELALTL